MKKYQKNSIPPQISFRLSSNKSGFTLIELLVVIAVLGILAAVLLVGVNPLEQIARARDAGRKSALKQVANALNNSLVFNGSYPDIGDCWEGQPCWTLQNFKLTGEIKILPADPKGGNTGSCNNTGDITNVCHVYHYCTPDGGKTFILSVNLESGPTKLSSTTTGCEYMSGSHIYYIYSN